MTLRQPWQFLIGIWRSFTKPKGIGASSRLNQVALNLPVHNRVHKAFEVKITIFLSLKLPYITRYISCFSHNCITNRRCTELIGYYIRVSAHSLEATCKTREIKRAPWIRAIKISLKWSGREAIFYPIIDRRLRFIGTSLKMARSIKSAFREETTLCHRSWI